MTLQCQETVYSGTPICRGIAIGKAFFLKQAENMVTESSIQLHEVEDEVVRYQSAIAKALEDVKNLQVRLQHERVFDGAAILDAHLEMIQDSLFTTHIEEQIRIQRKNAEYVFQTVVNECQEKFDSIIDPFFKERFKDIKAISQRVLGHLRENMHCLAEVPQNSVVFANDLTAFDTAEANVFFVNAFITRNGGTTSHAAIVARAKGIPYVSSVDIDKIDPNTNANVIVDGRTGKIILNPHPDTLKKYEQLRDQLNTHLQKLKQTGKFEAETFDGYSVDLSANVELVSEIDFLHQSGGSGVGLLRTESTILAKENFPSEEEQFKIYQRFVEKMDGLPIVIRTFDLGGDKYLRNQQATHEDNPFLGCRAIRFLLREKEIFKIQLRAILRASVLGEVRILFPMVSALSELLEAKEILEECKQELMGRGIKIPAHIPIGCMIEVPSAAIISDILAKECDFLSIGTNDLVQYTLAVDRTNSGLSYLYTPTHPGVIRLIRLVVSEASQYGIPVTICGEIAADPRFTPLLLGLGVHELSVSSRNIPLIKNAIRSISIIGASKLAEKVLTLQTAEEIEDLLTKEYRLNVPEDCLYNC